ncbi:MAG: tetratricopeptide repeat protein [Limisphaerales bacterium]
MNLRTNSSAVLALLLAGTISALSQSADQQLGFAQHLQRSGDAPFALLEFKRFIYLHPKDQRAASAHRDVADLYFGYFKDVDSGKAALAQLLKDFPKSKEAPGAQETLNLLSLYRGGQSDSPARLPGGLSAGT